jgi:hypothetical protein
MKPKGWLCGLFVLAILMTGVAAPAWAQPAGAGDATAATEAAPAPAAAAEAADDEASFADRAWTYARDDAWPVARQVLLALGLFLLGWILAKLVSWMLYRVLCKTDWDDRLAEKLGFRMLMEEEGTPNRVERMTAKAFYYLLMMVVIIAVLQYAGLTEAAAPFQSFVNRITESLPLIGKAVLILVVAYFAGIVLSKMVTGALDRMKVDEKFAELSTTGGKAEGEGEGEGEAKQRTFSDNAGRVVFWLLMVGGLAGAVDALEIGPLAHASQNALDRIVQLLPSLAIAAALVVAGYILGRIARAVIDNALDTAGLNRLVERVQLEKIFGETRASGVVGIAAMVFIILQTSIAALEELKLETLSEPLTEMMTRFWNFLPVLAVSVLIIMVGVLAGRVIRGVVESSLDNMGFDDLMDKLGFGPIERDDKITKPHELVGLIVQVGIILVATVQALQNVQLFTWSGYVDGFIEYAVTHVAVALVIVAVGMALGNYVRDIIYARRRDDSDDTIRWIASFARYAVLVFAFTMAIHHLDVGPYFVLISFSLLFGSLCLALALALGLGARDVAGDIVKRQYNKARREIDTRAADKKKQPTPPDRGESPV